MNDEYSFLESLKSRKFVLTVLFAIVVVVNGVFDWGLSQSELITLATIIGVYNVANAAQHATQ